MNQQRKTIYALRRQVLEGTYQPFSLEDPKTEKERLRLEAEAAARVEITESGTWKAGDLAKEMRPQIAEMITVVAEKVAERDARMAAGEPIGDTRPLWRVLRGELWRQFGTLLDLEKRVEGDREAMIDWVAERVGVSLVQQRERIYDLCEHLIGVAIDQFCSLEKPDDEWDLEGLEEALEEQFATEFTLQNAARDELAAQAWKIVETRMEEREKELSRAWLMYFSRRFFLEEIDQQWIDHLKTMDALREGIGLMGYGQKAPKKEYKKQGYELFQDMMARIQLNVGQKIFKVEVRREADPIPALEAKKRQMEERGAAGKFDEEAEQAANAGGAATAGAGGKRKKGGGARGQAARGNAAVAPPAETVRRDKPKVGRNDPCPCGSGKKYKTCHGKDEAEASAE
jgi:preprotein translocase subunit SecA